MRRRYGAFYDKSPRVRLDRHKVPERYWPLLHYAEFWGITDDGYREELVNQAPPAVAANLKQVVAALDAELNEWLAGPDASKPKLILEYVAFVAMTMAAYSA